jgi:hypothetical protein
MEDHKASDVPVEPGAVPLNNKPESFVRVGFQKFKNIAI